MQAKYDKERRGKGEQAKREQEGKNKSEPEKKWQKERKQIYLLYTTISETFSKPSKDHLY